MADSYTVLIIEDTPELAEINEITLKKYENITTYVEMDGQNAIERYRELQPDLILLDLNLPDMRGWNVLDAIREMMDEDDSLKMPKVIVTTAYGDPANRVMGKLQEVIQYIVKPFTPTDLEEAVLANLGIEDDA